MKKVNVAEKARVTNARQLVKYMNALWNGFLLTKSITDKLLEDEQFRFAVERQLSPDFLSFYAKVTKIIDITMLFKDLANEEYLSATNNLIQAWDNISQENKESFKEDYPDEFELIKNKINLLRN